VMLEVEEKEWKDKKMTKKRETVTIEGHRQ
jgi:hypothetical protein